VKQTVVTIEEGQLDLRGKVDGKDVIITANPASVSLIVDDGEKDVYNELHFDTIYDSSSKWYVPPKKLKAEVVWEDEKTLYTMYAPHMNTHLDKVRDLFDLMDNDMLTEWLGVAETQRDELAGKLDNLDDFIRVAKERL
jgi:hypothetical protein